MNQVQIYNAPNNIPLREDFRVKVRPVGGEWQPLLIYEVKVDMHQVRPASLAFLICRVWLKWKLHASIQKLLM